MNIIVRHTAMELPDDILQGVKGYRVDRKGYLRIWGDRSQTRAIYAPGTWSSAVQQHDG